MLSSALVFAVLALQSPSPGHRGPRPPRARSVSTQRAPAGLDLYSARARRRLANLLRLQLLELRKAGLERVSRALLRRLGGAGDLDPPTLRP